MFDMKVCQCNMCVCVCGWSRSVRKYCFGLQKGLKFEFLSVSVELLIIQVKIYMYLFEKGIRVIREVG